MNTILRFMKEPSFEGRLTFTLAVEGYGDEAKYYGNIDYSEYTGYRAHDGPSLSYDLDAANVNKVIADIRRTPIAVWPEGDMGLDGTRYELALGDGFFCGVTLRWWCWVPENWKPLIAAIGPVIPLDFGGYLARKPRVRVWDGNGARDK